MGQNELIPYRPAQVPVDQERLFTFCEQIAFGRDLSEIEKDPGALTKAEFLAEVMRNPQAGLIFDKARAMSAYAQEDDALTRLREALGDKKMTQVDVRKLESYVGQLRWSAAKRNPQVFSERSNVNVTVPIQINTSLPMGGEGIGGGTTDFPNIYELKADVVREVDEPTVEEALESQAEARKQRRALPATKKRILVPKKRPGETEVEAEARVEAEKLAAVARLQRMAKSQRAAKERAKMRKFAKDIVEEAGSGDST